MYDVLNAQHTQFERITWKRTKYKNGTCAPATDEIVQLNIVTKLYTQIIDFHAYVAGR